MRSVLLLIVLAASASAQPATEATPGTWGQRVALTLGGAATGAGAFFAIDTMMSGGPEGLGVSGSVALVLSYPLGASAGMLLVGTALGMDAPPLEVGARIVAFTPLGLFAGILTGVGGALALGATRGTHSWPPPSVIAGAYIGAATAALIPPLLTSGRFRTSSVTTGPLSGRRQIEVVPVVLAAPTGEAAPGLSLRLDL